MRTSSIGTYDPFSASVLNRLHSHDSLSDLTLVRANSDISSSNSTEDCSARRQHAHTHTHTSTQASHTHTHTQPSFRQSNAAERSRSSGEMVKGNDDTIGPSDVERRKWHMVQRTLSRLLSRTSRVSRNKRSNTRMVTEMSLSRAGTDRHLLNLPPELLAKILCCTDAQTILTCSTVCKALRRTCLGLWQADTVFVATGRRFEAWAGTIRHLDVQIKAPSGMTMLSKMYQLQSLHCSNLTTLLPLDSLRCLTRLDLSDSCSIVEVDALAQLPQMKELKLRGLCFMRTIAALSALVNLELLDLGHCHSLGDVDAISKLPNLKRLSLRNCLALEAIPHIAMPPLVYLDLQGCTRIMDLDPLVDCKDTLQTLVISQLQVTRTEAMVHLCALEVLEMNGCSMISDMQDIAKVETLRRLSCKSSKLWDIAPLANLRALTHLDLSSSTYILDISTIHHLTNLEYLNLSGNRHAVTDIGALSSLTKLRTLYMTMCKVDDIRPVRQMVLLESLSLAFCMQVADLAPLSGLQNLRRLDLDFCRGIKDLSPIQNLPKLESLSTEGLGPGLIRDAFGPQRPNSGSWGARAWAKLFPAA
ncbi:hypothetical protein, variant [Sphaeroforma arctica JP610]|uniref:F-box domain-containing protein n=1 Tax=Sphaeroforma arctica JP610 TaxID=667725 RepID=A0A0L0G831_9EUKA|nr:hypothetical protein, variant [Sphaeroforma arctica JP610]KNC85187.1 hypothetical protein, variant [Sphaeroforma arctica JP610]|eukprot:XP_014159090.1 hypothetical protein, variant [Sphaeroforma arctica JP610]